MFLIGVKKTSSDRAKGAGCGRKKQALLEKMHAEVSLDTKDSDNVLRQRQRATDKLVCGEELITRRPAYDNTLWSNQLCQKICGYNPLSNHAVTRLPVMRLRSKTDEESLRIRAAISAQPGTVNSASAPGQPLS